MCIAICGFNQYPTRKELEQSCKNNPDGFGWAFVIKTETGRKLEQFKTMEAQVAIDTYKAFIKDNGKNILSHAFHARIATHGAVNLYGCHPFPVSDDSDSVLIHNGILPINIKKTDPRSDSRIFAEDFLPKVGGVHALADPDIYDLMEGFVEGSGSKVVILSTTLEVPLLILGEDRGAWDKERPNLWFSNNSHRVYPAYGSSSWTTTGVVKSGFDSDTMVRCANWDCRSYVHMIDEVCKTCNWCQLCEQSDINCLCWGETVISKEPLTPEEKEAFAWNSTF